MSQSKEIKPLFNLGEHKNISIIKEAETKFLNDVDFYISHGYDLSELWLFGTYGVEPGSLFHNKNFVQFLITKGADVNKEPLTNSSPLRLAIESCVNVEIIEVLLNNGADVNGRDNLFSPVVNDVPLYCIQTQSLRLLQMFIDKGVDLNAYDIERYTPLKIALSKFAYVVEGLCEKCTSEAEEEYNNLLPMVKLMLLSGARISADHIRYVFSKRICNSALYPCLKMLVKYYALQQTVTSQGTQSKIPWAKCHLRQEMDFLYQLYKQECRRLVDDGVIRDLDLLKSLKSSKTRNEFSASWEAWTLTLRLFQSICKGNYPLYHDYLAHNFSRCMMHNAVEKPFRGEIQTVEGIQDVRLNYYCNLEIFTYLSDADLLNLGLALYGYESIEMKHGVDTSFKDRKPKQIWKCKKCK